MQLARRRLQLVICALFLPAAPVTADPVVTFAVDTLIYSDSDRVIVVSPQASARARWGDDGTEVAARVVVDAMTCASVDVVSQATRGFDETREEANLSAAWRLGAWLPSASYRFSYEPDYTSHGALVGFERRLGGPDTVLQASYALALDTVGRSGGDGETDVGDWSRALATHSAEASITQALDPRTILRLVGSFTLQQGYLEKPYRFVPLFDQSWEGRTGELDFDNFDEHQLPERVPESVPDRRLRPAIALRGVRWIAALEGSARADYRFYVDSWGMLAHTVELGVRARLPARLELEVRDRLHRQSAVDFWERAYVVVDPLTAPRWRSLDRELGSYWSNMAAVTLGWTRGRWTAYGEVDVMYTHFVDFMLLDSRTALIGQLGARFTP